MSIHDFPGFLQAARSQDQPQRLLLVFATAELPEHATAEEKAGFERSEGGALVPAMCVDKTPQEIIDFATLVRESSETGVDWAIMFVAAMSGRNGQAPSSDDAAKPLQDMVQAVKDGRLGNFLAVNRDGELVELASG